MIVEEPTSPQSTLVSGALLAQVRQLEPEADLTKVGVLIDELREAEQELRRVSVEGVALPVGFSSNWPEVAAP